MKKIGQIAVYYSYSPSSLTFTHLSGDLFGGEERQKTEVQKYFQGSPFILMDFLELLWSLKHFKKSLS